MQFDYTSGMVMGMHRAGEGPEIVFNSGLLSLQAKRYLDPSSIFHSDIDEAMQRLTLSIQILKFFRELFDYYKERLAAFFTEPEERPPILWTFHPNSVFKRFNAFLERLTTIQWYGN